MPGNEYRDRHMYLTAEEQEQVRQWRRDKEAEAEENLRQLQQSKREEQDRLLHPTPKVHCDPCGAWTPVDEVVWRHNDGADAIKVCPECVASTVPVSGPIEMPAPLHWVEPPQPEMSHNRGGPVPERSIFPLKVGGGPETEVGNPRDLDWDDLFEAITGKRPEHMAEVEDVLWSINIHPTNLLLERIAKHCPPGLAAKMPSYLRGWAVTNEGGVRRQMIAAIKGALKYNCYNGPVEYWLGHLLQELDDVTNYAVQYRAVLMEQRGLDPHAGVPAVAPITDRPPHAHRPAGDAPPPAAELRQRATHPDAPGVVAPGGQYITAEDAEQSCKSGR